MPERRLCSPPRSLDASTPEEHITQADGIARDAGCAVPPMQPPEREGGFNED
jgi:hypothetical protein